MDFIKFMLVRNLVRVALFVSFIGLVHFVGYFADRLGLYLGPGIKTSLASCQGGFCVDHFIYGSIILFLTAGATFTGIVLYFRIRRRLIWDYEEYMARQPEGEDGRNDKPGEK